MVIQQGDVLFIQVPKNKVPEAKKSVQAGPRGFVLAEGEKTGHFHILEAHAGTTLHEIDGDDDFILHVEKESEVVHDEHGTGIIPAGDYVIRKVQEYDHFAEEARKVQD